MAHIDSKLNFTPIKVENIFLKTRLIVMENNEGHHESTENLPQVPRGSFENRLVKEDQ